MAPEMTEQVFGLTVNEAMAYAAIANVALVVVLVVINTYYARQANRQAKASKEQVAASNRQAEVAQKSLDLLLKQREEQRRIDLSTVRFQLEAAIHMIGDWRERIGSETYNDLPDVVEIRPTNFNSSIANADRIDGIVAGYMSASLVYIAAAEADIRVMRDPTPSAEDATSPLVMMMRPQIYKQRQAKAEKNLSIARFKLDEARTRLGAITEGEQQSATPTNDPTAKPSLQPGSSIWSGSAGAEGRTRGTS
jgi:hypothetical protein